MPSKTRIRKQCKCSKDSDDEISNRKDQYSEDTVSEELVCCIHGKPCELKEHHKGNSSQVNRIKLLSASIRIISICPTPPNSPCSSLPTPKELDYENLELLNGQAVKAPADTSSSSGGSYYRRSDYELVSDGVEACYESIEDPDCTKSVVALNSVMEPQEDLLKTIYLGKMSRAMAETVCKEKVSFLLYNRFPSGHSEVCKHMPPQLPLFIVYRTSMGDCCHYRIVERDVMSSQSHARRRNSQINQYRVDIPGEPYFFSLEALVSYYQTYVMVREAGVVDIFPWWLTKGEYFDWAKIYADFK